jgi:hypothetical protein
MEYRNLSNKLGNLELLLSHENQEKSDQNFESWLSTRDHSFKKKHLIPDDQRLYKFENFPLFIQEREKLIKHRLSTLFS